MDAVNTKPYILPPDATWLITGCSSGIGREIARLITNNPPLRLIATARNPSTLDYLPDDNTRILKVALDVTSTVSVNAAFTSAAAHFNPSDPENFHIDVVVNNAGYSLSGDTESATEEQAHDELETLFFGTARVTTRAISIMRRDRTVSGTGDDQPPTRRRGGLIFQVSSLAGICGFAGHAYYHAGKFAVEGWTESVAREMHPDWHINFCILEPSGVRTEFEGGSKRWMAPHPAYTDPSMPARKLETYVRKGLASAASSGMMIDPAKLAQTVLDVASRGRRSIGADASGGGGDDDLKIPLRLPLGSTALAIGKMALESRLAELERYKELGSI